MHYTLNPFTVHYDKPEAFVGDFRTECIKAARQVAALNTENKPILVTMSGGLDSELAAEALYAAGIQFTALIGKLQVEVATETLTLNSHDYSFAETWCNARGIKIVYCCLDIYKDAKTLTEYALSADGHSPQYAWHMHLLKWAGDNGYFFVAGIGNVEVVLKDGSYWCVDTPLSCCLDKFCEQHKLTGVLRFIKLGSNLTAAFLNMSSTRKLIEHRIPTLIKHKHDCLVEAFPNMLDRPKFTGFERIQEWDSILRTYLHQRFPKPTEIFYTPVSHFIE